jgi:hypothetical protein
MLPNWTDSIIHWNQLGSTATKRLIDTWGKDEAFIRKYDAKHGHVSTAVAVPAKTATKTEATTPAKAVKKATTVAPKKAVAKAPVKRQKHVGTDGEIKFLDHRNLYIGFFGGKVVVTKRTAEQCREVLAKEYGVE